MYKVIKGEHTGRIGHIEECKDNLNVMFYPIDGQYPYRVCLKKDEVEKIKTK